MQDRLRKLALDNDDMTFECARLRASLEHAQREILALTERNTALQSQLDRIRGFAPWGSGRILTTVRRWIGQR